MIPNDLQENFYYPPKTLEVTFYLFFFFNFHLQRSILMWKWQNKGTHAIDLSFDARFVKYYQFSFHYYKQPSINNIKVKCLQIGQNVLGID